MKLTFKERTRLLDLARVYNGDVFVKDGARLLPQLCEAFIARGKSAAARERRAHGVMMLGDAIKAAR